MRIFTFFITLVLFINTSGFNTNAQRYICHGIGNLEDKVNHGISVMDKMVNAGCNSTLLTIWWDKVYQKPNSKANWAQIDNQINHAVNVLKIKVALRIHLGRHISFTSGFWNEEEAVSDFRGKPLTYYYDNNHFSFAHQPSVEKAGDFVKEVCERYKDLQQKGHIIFVSVVNTPQQELGYAYENQQYPNPGYPAVYDHSKWSMIKWKDWAKTKYQTIRTLNSYWGTTYKNFSEVEPYVNWFNTKDSFKGRRGKDWYVFRHLLLKNYIDYFSAAVKSVDPNYKVACEFGGVGDNLALLRGTYAFKNLSEKTDIIKTSVDGYQGDLVYNNLKPGQKYFTEVAHFDLPTSDALRNYVKKAVEYNCSFIMLGVDYDNGIDFEKMLPAVQEGVKWINTSPAPVVFADSIKYRLSQLIDGQDAALEDWKAKSHNGRDKLKFIYDEDLLLEKQIVDNPLPDLPDPDPVNPNPNPPDPPKPPVQEGPNEAPFVNIKDYTYQVVVNQPFIFRLPETLVLDPDGFIAYMEVVSGPSWANFNKFEFSFYGRAFSLGKTKIRIRVYDNKGASIETDIYIESIPPVIDFELIKADYFDVPIQGWGMVENNRTLYMESLPEKLNILARCNLDSVNFHFELTGPYRFKNVSQRAPYNLFGEGRGITFPIGSYTLTAKAYKKDTLITYKTIQFKVKRSTDSTENVLNDWVVYPNPFENICNIKLPAEEDFSTLEFSLYTSAGKQLYLSKDYMKLVNGVVYLDLGLMDIIAGSYILEIRKAGAPLKRIRIVKM